MKEEWEVSEDNIFLYPETPVLFTNSLGMHDRLSIQAYIAPVNLYIVEFNLTDAGTVVEEVQEACRR